jgi:hypothetical protein
VKAVAFSSEEDACASRKREQRGADMGLHDRALGGPEGEIRAVEGQLTDIC